MKKHLEDVLNDQNNFQLTGKCFICGNEIPKTFEHFQIYGNCCIKCSREADKQIRLNVANGAEIRRFNRSLQRQEVIHSQLLD